jgi:alanyl-tRNA synthetase
MNHIRIRDEFLGFFESKGHRIVPSDSLVPAGDTTLLFTSAGMTQFKDEFMGNIGDFKRAASCQRCMRTADLENVGRTAYHHSFFEMLGNFSFGDYFKQEAITWAWEFLTGVLKIRPRDLWVSVYDEDDESYGIWKDAVRLPLKRIIRLGQKDNFWPSEARDNGPNGPCGPCSEIYYDYGIETGCGKTGCSPACSCGRFVEVWNLVFTQFDRKDGGILEPLPNKGIDTGMGIERLCAVMQGVRNNFETDLFTPIIETMRNEFPARVIEYPVSNIYAIADHIRAVTFAISDGITPSNEERGYVIRNILRRALLQAIDLGAVSPVLYKIVYSVAKTMQVPYPELLKRHQDIAGIIKIEEERFFNTLRQGKRLLKNVIEQARVSGDNIITGASAFRLFDTHGLPLAIIKQICSREGLTVDEQAFNALMESQREQSRRSSNLTGAVFVDPGIKEKTVFIGYDKDKAQAKVLRILLPDGRDIPEADRSEPMIEIILDRSVFYPQQGGQEPDKGRIFSRDMETEVSYAKKVQSAVLLQARVLRGNISKGDIVECRIDKVRRAAITKNHTATHLLQSALRDVLGDHVQQQGSMVDADRLRFDFTHFKAMTDDELKRTEEKVNRYIKQALPVGIEEMDIGRARDTGALAFFGERYAQRVRVVRAGDNSLELCGGTHLDNTSGIGLFRITRECSVASGIRRIEAVTAEAARARAAGHEKKENERIQALKNKQQKKARSKALIKQAEGLVNGIIADAQVTGNATVIIKCLEGQNMGALKRISDIIKVKFRDEYIIFFAALEGRRATLLLLTGNKLVAKGVDSSQVLTEILRHFSGSGGGRPDMAQGGIRDLRESDALLSAARDAINAVLRKII